MLLVHRGIRIIRHLPRGINQGRDLAYSLDTHVTQGGICYRVLGIKTKGEACVMCLIQCISREEQARGAVFKGQDSHVCLEVVSSGAEVAIDEQAALPLVLCCRSMVAKAIK